MAICIVNTGNNNGVNVRSEKRVSSTTLLGVIDNNESVNIVRCDSTWATLMYNGAPAFLQHQYVDNPPTQNGDGLNTGDNNIAVCNGNNVNIRDAANGDTTGNMLDKGDRVTIYQKSLVGGYYWYRIGTNQWVRGDFLAPATAGSTGGNSGSGTGSGTGVNTATWSQVLAGNGVYKKESSSSAVCEGVKTLQTYLKAIGYGTNNVGNIVVDGNFGSITETAVKYFQTECDLDDDGIVGSATANKLAQAQNKSIFKNENYFPLKSSLFKYSTYPYSESSLVARIICAEHGSEGSGHYEGRIGVAKVLKNRKDSGGVTLYDNSKPRDYKNIIFGANQYTTAASAMAYRVRRGSTAFEEAVEYANDICAGRTPSGADNVTDQLFQKGYTADSATYRSKPDYCRYPEATAKYSFFYNEN